MNKFKISLGFLLLGFIVNGQDAEVSREWTSFVQTIDVSTDKKIKFKVRGAVKVDTLNGRTKAGLWTRVDNAGGYGFFDNMMDRPITKGDWEVYEIEGYLDEKSKFLNFGGLVMDNGDFYFDKIEVFTEDKNGDFIPLPIQNPSFENLVINNIIPQWNNGITKDKTTLIKEFKFKSSKDAYDGTSSMLNSLSTRVERVVGGYSQREIDYILDDQANSIGALVYHLAAAEKIYQLITFENRRFNEEELKIWGAAMDLDEKGRQDIQGKPISYYLNILKEVRAKTMEELKKRDDEWFLSTTEGSEYNNQWAWFHVMEHQSSHLGQILLMLKRLPDFKEDELNPEIKD